MSATFAQQFAENRAKLAVKDATKPRHDLRLGPGRLCGFGHLGGMLYPVRGPLGDRNVARGDVAVAGEQGIEQFVAGHRSQRHGQTPCAESERNVAKKWPLRRRSSVTCARSRNSWSSGRPRPPFPRAPRRRRVRGHPLRLRRLIDPFLEQLCSVGRRCRRWCPYPRRIAWDCRARQGE